MPTLAENLSATLPATITADTDPHIADRFGVTYHGLRPFLTLYALIRTDLTDLGDSHTTMANAVRLSATCLAHWFTHPHRDPRHAETFEGYTPAQVCELVAYLTLHTDAAPPIGPRTVAAYTRHLTDGSIRTRPVPPLPQPVDAPPLYVANPAASLPITVTTPSDTVPITVEFDAEEHLTWSGKSVTVEIPADEVAAALLTPRMTFTTLLEENRSLTDAELRNDTAACTVPRGLRGLDITVTRLTPTTPAKDTMISLITMPRTGGEPSIPMPNDRITLPDGTVSAVIASVVLDDDTDPNRFLVLLLNPAAPFYSVAETDATGAVTILGSYPNIVPAVTGYTDHGGDF